MNNFELNFSKEFFLFFRRSVVDCWPNWLGIFLFQSEMTFFSISVEPNFFHIHTLFCRSMGCLSQEENRRENQSEQFLFIWIFHRHVITINYYVIKKVIPGCDSLNEMKSTVYLVCEHHRCVYACNNHVSRGYMNWYW